MTLLRKLLAFVWEIFESATFAMAIFVVAYLFFFQPGEVHGTSSYPTWKENERFITDKISYRLSEPKRSDFVVMQAPQNSDVDFIKRIVGLPGEQIRISNCYVFINSVLLPENYLQPGTCTGPETFLKENVTFTIPQGYYFVMGDNRSHSSDSRDFGPIPKFGIVGKVLLRYWPPDRIGLISTDR